MKTRLFVSQDGHFEPWNPLYDGGHCKVQYLGPRFPLDYARLESVTEVDVATRTLYPVEFAAPVEWITLLMSSSDLVDVLKAKGFLEVSDLDRLRDALVALAKRSLCG